MVSEHESGIIRVLIVDDHPIVREGLRGVISNKAGMEVVGEAEDGFEAVSMNRSLQPDLILMDLIMPRMNGLDAIKEIKKESPDVKILVLTSFLEGDKLKASIEAGAQGFLLKDSSPQELFRAIRDVHAGKLTLHPAAARLMIEKPPSAPLKRPDQNPLKDREITILSMIARGYNNKEIAAALVVSDQTVRSYVSIILEKLNLSNRSQAVLYALREGLVQLDESPESPPDSDEQGPPVS
jgi:two-component system, NarL family, response regulator LiaR